MDNMSKASSFEGSLEVFQGPQTPELTQAEKNKALIEKIYANFIEKREQAMDALKNNLNLKFVIWHSASSPLHYGIHFRGKNMPELIKKDCNLEEAINICLTKYNLHETQEKSLSNNPLSEEEFSEIKRLIIKNEILFKGQSIEIQDKIIKTRQFEICLLEDIKKTSSGNYLLRTMARRPGDTFLATIPYPLTPEKVRMLIVLLNK